MELGVPDWRREDFFGFPPLRDYVLLPRRPKGAAIAGLVMYDPSLRHQQLAAHAGRGLLRLGLGGLLPVRRMPHLPDPGWWERWLHQVVVPAVGAPAAVAFRAVHAQTGNPPRTTALLVGAGGEPLAFAKLTEAVAAGSRLGMDALRLLERTEPGVFRVPELLASGVFEGAEFLLQRPMPARHVGAGRRPDLVGRVVDELQSRLVGLPRPEATPADHVPVHTAVSPGNLRLDPDGSAWLIDWDKAQWGPPLADELRYWLAYYARRPGRVHRRAARVVDVLVARGPLEQIEEALRWRIAFRPQEPDRVQQRMRDAMAARLGRV